MGERFVRAVNSIHNHIVAPILKDDVLHLSDTEEEDLLLDEIRCRVAQSLYTCPMPPVQTSCSPCSQQTSCCPCLRRSRQRNRRGRSSQLIRDTNGMSDPLLNHQVGSVAPESLAIQVQSTGVEANDVSSDPGERSGPYE